MPAEEKRTQIIILNSRYLSPLIHQGENFMNLPTALNLAKRPPDDIGEF